MSKSVEKFSTHLPAWKRASLVAVAGILFGLGMAISFRSIHRPAQTAQRWVQVADRIPHPPAPSTINVETTPLRQAAAGDVDGVEIEKLKTRNRRLEALVQVLKKRSQEKKQP